ncbi:hypothetical protein LINPERHAP1_LOCUS14453 [Linum perenne]
MRVLKRKESGLGTERNIL